MSSLMTQVNSCPSKLFAMEHFGVTDYDNFSRLRKIYRMIQESELELKAIGEEEHIHISEFWEIYDKLCVFDKMDRIYQDF